MCHPKYTWCHPLLLAYRASPAGHDVFPPPPIIHRTLPGAMGSTWPPIHEDCQLVGYISAFFYFPHTGIKQKQCVREPARWYGKFLFIFNAWKLWNLIKPASQRSIKAMGRTYTHTHLCLLVFLWPSYIWFFHFSVISLQDFKHVFACLYVLLKRSCCKWVKETTDLLAQPQLGFNWALLWHVQSVHKFTVQYIT